MIPARLALVALLALVAACGSERGTPIVLTMPTSAVGAEAEVLDRQLRRFERMNPNIRVDRRVTPDAAEQRRQLYVQWLNAGASQPDVLQLDTIWTAEFAAAGWILPLEPSVLNAEDFFAGAVEACTYGGRLYAVPWFVDVGMLYYRTDLVRRPPETFAELEQAARRAVDEGRVQYGFVWQGKRYEGLITVFLEHLVGFGGRIIDERGRVAVNSPEAVRALDFMRQGIVDGIVPRSVLAWQEEQTRHAFEGGQSAFMRNWPYAYSLMQRAESPVRGKFAVTVMPKAEGGTHAATLGGQQLAINRESAHPEEARALIEYLTRPEQMLERARVVGQLPARRTLYDDPALSEALAIDAARARDIIEHAVPRPPTPIYAELSAHLQIPIHRALTGQMGSRAALDLAASAMKERSGRARLGPDSTQAPAGSSRWAAVVGSIVAVLAFLFAWRLSRGVSRRGGSPSREERGLAVALAGPALLVITAVGLGPALWTLWESVHLHDLRMPWLGRPYVGLDNYVEAFGSDRFWGAMGRTGFFVGVSVSLEVLCGVALAVVVFRAGARRLFRATLLLPWAMPTVVAGLVWRFAFDGRGAVVNLLAGSIGLSPVTWLSDATAAWVPIIVADVWKTTPFVALLVLAQLETIDAQYHEAARLDGAGAWQVFWFVTLPFIKPAVAVAAVFRALDAIRLFDLVYVLTGGGPGTATEPIAMLVFRALLDNLRFGYGAALSAVVFVLSLVVAAIYFRFGPGLERDRA